MIGKQMLSKRELLLAVPAFALAACSSSDRAGTMKDGNKGATTTLVVTFLPTPGVSKVVDLDPAGPSLGDRLEFLVRVHGAGSYAPTRRPSNARAPEPREHAGRRGAPRGFPPANPRTTRRRRPRP